MRYLDLKKNEIYNFVSYIFSTIFPLQIFV